MREESASGLPEISEESRKYLLKIAKDAIKNHLSGKLKEKLSYEDPVLLGHYGAFVTLRKDGELRGCIGTIFSEKPIPETVQDIAVKSATVDTRFHPVERDELESITVEISILGPMIEVKDIDEIVLGRDGLVIEHHGRRGLLLPQVAPEHGLDKEMFLEHTCLKAGVPPDSWKHGAKIYRFSGMHF